MQRSNIRLQNDKAKFKMSLDYTYRIHPGNANFYLTAATAEFAEEKINGNVILMKMV